MQRNMSQNYSALDTTQHSFLPEDSRKPCTGDGSPTKPIMDVGISPLSRVAKGMYHPKIKKARQNGVRFGWANNLAGRLSTSVGSRDNAELATLLALAGPQY